MNTTKNPGSNPMFNFEGHDLRLVLREGNPWFVLIDACLSLGMKDTNVTNSIKHLLADEKMVIRKDTLAGGKGTAGFPYITIISESGLYKLIMRSDKPAAKRFQDWVTREVLPALRQDGMYVMGEEKVRTGEMSEDELVLKAMTLLQKKTERLTQELGNAKAIINDNLVCLTLDGWRALNSHYLTKSQIMSMAWNLKKTLERQGVTVPTESREYTLPTGEVIDTVVKIYPKAMLDQAALELGIPVNMKFDLVAKVA